MYILPLKNCATKFVFMQCLLHAVIKNRNIFRDFSCVVGNRSSNFIVGLTDIHPDNSTPMLWNYTLCGQYSGAVSAGATVSVYCPHNIPPFMYVIVQFPLQNDQMTVCEVKVFATGIDDGDLIVNRRISISRSNV